MKLGLDSLPDDVLLLLLRHLETARDVASLARSCRRLHLVVRDEDGWRVFVRSRFPSLALPQPTRGGGRGWEELAESLTWQSRCWDKRSLTFKALLPRSPHGAGRRAQGTPFHTVLDAHLCPGTGEELVVWGAGENIIARRRRRGDGGPGAPAPAWYRSHGHDYGFAPGYDDVKAVSIVGKPGARAGELAILAGRDNGQLALLSADDDSFGRPIASFGPARADGDSDGAGAGAGHGTINSLDVSSRPAVFAATTNSSVLLYALPHETPAEAAPSAVFDLGRDVFESKSMTLSNARWMGEGLLALGLSGGKDPLRYLTLTPTGFAVDVAAKNGSLAEQYGAADARLCASSLQPLSAASITGGGANLLLSAWRDGTCRLQDIRTPSPFDAVYCDNIDPWSDFEALLPFGTDRFVAGGAGGATLKVFDLRWARRYVHTAALPCGADRPFPTPHQPFAAPPPDPRPRVARCDHARALRCRWHQLSREVWYRPNCTFFLAKSLPREEKHAGVWSLGRASDAAPGFYAGISGGVVEVSLGSPSAGAADPHLGFPAPGGSGGEADRKAAAGGGAGYVTWDMEASVMETGDGLASPDRDRNIRIPPMRGRGWRALPLYPTGAMAVQELRARHRLDAKYQLIDDFKEKEAGGRWAAASA